MGVPGGESALKALTFRLGRNPSVFVFRGYGIASWRGVLSFGCFWLLCCEISAELLRDFGNLFFHFQGRLLWRQRLAWNPIPFGVLFGGGPEMAFNLLGNRLVRAIVFEVRQELIFVRVGLGVL